MLLKHALFKVAVWENRRKGATSVMSTQPRERRLERDERRLDSKLIGKGSDSTGNKSPGTADRNPLMDSHDMFNLLTLPFCIYLNFCYFVDCLDFKWAPGSWTPVISNNSNAATVYVNSLNFWAFLAYLVVDTLWIMIWPTSVPSAPQLVFHHIGTLVGWVSPLWEQRWAFWSALAAMVEINTFFLILKRQGGKDYLIVHVLFYASWVLLRCVVYPIGLFYFSVEFWNYSQKHPMSFLNSGLGMFLLICFLNALNTRWTWDLAKKLIWPGPKI